jgi:UDP-N-acetylglucosamine--N-acetylmuramyl-(pentapeptide) pyrophosphoryl-undecaprenol N-acetylglucosamine transferase
MGGFASGPGGVAAWLLRRPLVIHEQNAVAGLTNRLLARLARVVLQAFPGSFSPGIKAETVGNPVRADIAALDEPQSRYAGREGPLRLLILGGSQGAFALNKVVPAALALLPDELQPVVRHQAGARTLAAAQAAYEAHGIEVDLRPFIEDMAEAYAWADLVVCRAGALTVAELSAAGVPAIFVPYPSAVDDHQTANARPMTDAGAAALMPETDLSDKSLADLLRHWLASRDALLQRALKSRALAHPDALRRITNCCLRAAGATP